MDTDEYAIRGGADEDVSSNVSATRDANATKDVSATRDANATKDVSATRDRRVPATSGGIDGAA